MVKLGNKQKKILNISTKTASNDVQLKFGYSILLQTLRLHSSQGTNFYTLHKYIFLHWMEYKVKWLNI